MATYIEKESLAKDLTELARYQEPYKQSTILGVVSTIENRKPADVVEVVRCKDCDFCDETKRCQCDNSCKGLIREDDDFCSYGEVKERER